MAFERRFVGQNNRNYHTGRLTLANNNRPFQQHCLKPFEAVNRNCMTHMCV